MNEDPEIGETDVMRAGETSDDLTERANEPSDTTADKANVTLEDPDEVPAEGMPSETVVLAHNDTTTGPVGDSDFAPDETAALDDAEPAEDLADQTTIMRARPLYAEDGDSPVEDNSAGLFSLGDMEGLTEGIDLGDAWESPAPDAKGATPDAEATELHAGDAASDAFATAPGVDGEGTDDASTARTQGKKISHTVLMPRPKRQKTASTDENATDTSTPATPAAPNAPAPWDPDEGTSYIYGAASRKQDHRAERDLLKRRAKHDILSVVLWVITIAIVGVMCLRTIPLYGAIGGATAIGGSAVAGSAASAGSAATTTTSSSAASTLVSFGAAAAQIVALLPFTAMPLVVIVVLAILWRRRNLTVVAGAALVLLCYWHLGFFRASGQLSAGAAAPSASDTSARVMTLNTNHGAADAEQIVATVRDQGVEVLAMQEVTSDFLERLRDAGIGDYLPHYVYGTQAASGDGEFNALLLTTTPADASSNLVPTEASAMPAGSIELGNKNVRFISAHPGTPALGAQDLWTTGLTGSDELGSYDGPCVVMGDFGATWDHQVYRSLLGNGFVDAGEQAGEGFHNTYPSGIESPALAETDHVAYSSGSDVYAANLATVQIDGTDHKALLATVEVQ
ncbi:MAG: endonuclease/exonuclease/phosphatase family protein [Olegusella sp.]|nr:endonuclease/exonuclease/phosphatase family protein [Olegusella sp.]